MIVRSRFGYPTSLALILLLGGVSAACTETSTPGGGSGTSPTSECSADGTGTLAVTVTGLPSDLAAKIALTDPSGAAAEVTASTSLPGKPAGTWTAKAERVATTDPIVRTVFEPSVSTSSFCVRGSETTTVTVAYTPIGSSNKVWTANGNSDSGQMLGFAGATLASTGTPAASVAFKGAVTGGPGKAVAFDKDGNMWSLGATTADAPLLRFAAAGLGSAGEKTPDRQIVPDFGGCGPAGSALAFDSTGALWVTVLCRDMVLRLSPERLNTSGEYAPPATDFATGVTAPKNLAFDKDGNMWVSGSSGLHRFSAASLGAARTPDFVLLAKTASDAPLTPDALAFDKDGNLWVTNFGGNVLYKLTPADLAVSGASKDVIPTTQITVSVGALLEGLAIDESGGLWFTFGQGKIARLAPAQLGTSSGPGEPTNPATVLTSADIGYAAGMAFFPAPANLPLYGRF